MNNEPPKDLDPTSLENTKTRLRVALAVADGAIAQFWKRDCMKWCDSLNNHKDILESCNLIYRLKPEWRLPDAPEGMQWHRTDWTEDMLPEGWRPHLLGERDEPGDQFINDGKWRDSRCFGVPSNSAHLHRRTKRPLPTVKKFWSVPERRIYFRQTLGQLQWSYDRVTWHECAVEETK